MEIVNIPTNQLKHLDHNARKLKHSQGIDKLAEQIRIHRFQNPLNVWEDPVDGKYAIIAGNHRFKAGTQIGMREFPCIIYEGSREKAYARSISDNKTNEFTTWDLSEFNIAILEFDIDPADCAFDKLKFADIVSFNEKQEIKNKIMAEKEYHYAKVDIDKLLAAYSRKLLATWQSDPENMNRASLVILPTDSGTKSIMILADPSTTDIIHELKRYAKAKNRSPLEKLAEAMVNYPEIVRECDDAKNP